MRPLEPTHQPIAMAVTIHLRNEVLRLLGYEPPGFGTVSPTGFGDPATRSHSPLRATSSILEILPSDRIKIAYSDSTPKHLALLVALVPAEPIFQRIRYGCDLSNDVGGIQTPTPPNCQRKQTASNAPTAGPVGPEEVRRKKPPAARSGAI